MDAFTVQWLQYVFLCFPPPLQCDHENPSEDTAASSDRLASCALLADSNMLATSDKDANTFKHL